MVIFRVPPTRAPKSGTLRKISMEPSEKGEDFGGQNRITGWETILLRARGTVDSRRTWNFRQVIPRFSVSRMDQSNWGPGCV